MAGKLTRTCGLRSMAMNGDFYNGMIYKKYFIYNYIEMCFVIQIFHNCQLRTLPWHLQAIWTKIIWHHFLLCWNVTFNQLRGTVQTMDTDRTHLTAMILPELLVVVAIRKRYGNANFDSACIRSLTEYVRFQYHLGLTRNSISTLRFILSLVKLRGWLY